MVIDGICQEIWVFYVNLGLMVCHHGVYMVGSPVLAQGVQYLDYWLIFVLNLMILSNFGVDLYSSTEQHWWKTMIFLISYHFYHDVLRHSATVCWEYQRYFSS